jgi:hypothetical protein
MHQLVVWLVLSTAIAASAGCFGEDRDPGDEVGSKPVSTAKRWVVRQVAPPLDVSTPPPDAKKSWSGVSYKKLLAHEAGAQPGSSDTALVHYSGWIRRTGQTFFTTDGGSAMAIDISHAAPGLREVLPLLHKGEKAMLWMPQGEGATEGVAYTVELVDVIAKTAKPPE